MPELPYLPFYGADFYSDARVKRMSHEQRALYMELLWHSWDYGSIPADAAEIAHILGITKRRLGLHWNKIEECWRSNGNGGLVNPKLEEVRRKQRAKRKAGSAGGRAGANA